MDIDMASITTMTVQSDTDNSDHAGDPATYYPPAKGFILVYGCDSMESLNALQKTWDVVNEHKEISAEVVVVAAKCDSLTQPALIERGQVHRTLNVPSSFKHDLQQMCAIVACLHQCLAG